MICAECSLTESIGILTARQTEIVNCNWEGIASRAPPRVGQICIPCSSYRVQRYAKKRFLQQKVTGIDVVFVCFVRKNKNTLRREYGGWSQFWWLISGIRFSLRYWCRNRWHHPICSWCQTYCGCWYGFPHRRCTSSCWYSFSTWNLPLCCHPGHSRWIPSEYWGYWSSPQIHMESQGLSGMYMMPLLWNGGRRLPCSFP